MRQVYQVDPSSLAAETGLEEGCEILAVNDRPVIGVAHFTARLLHCLEDGVSIHFVMVG